MRRLVLLAIIATGCANDPQYVPCGATDKMDLCTLDTANATGSGSNAGARGSIHVPVMPPDMDLMKTQMALQATMPADVMVPMYRLDQYDLSVEYTIHNLDAKDGQFKVQLNGANEMFAWDPSLIVPASNESPPTPSLGGDIPTDIPANGSVDGEFREDQLLEAAIDLDQISRGNVNPFAATLIVNKNDTSFQPMSTQLPPPPGSNQPPPQTPLGSAVPRSAFRQFVRVDLVLKTLGPHLTMDFTLRVRPHVDKVIDPMGMDAPAAEITIYDPAPYMPGYTP
jgi:hypothetical protein